MRYSGSQFIRESRRDHLAEVSRKATKAFEGSMLAHTLFSLARVASVDESLHYSCQYLRTALADISER